MDFRTVPFHRPQAKLNYSFPRDKSDFETKINEKVTHALTRSRVEFLIFRKNQGGKERKLEWKVLKQDLPPFMLFFISREMACEETNRRTGLSS